jgi:hypothetical protein
MPGEIVQMSFNSDTHQLNRNASSSNSTDAGALQTSFSIHSESTAWQWSESEPGQRRSTAEPGEREFSSPHDSMEMPNASAGTNISPSSATGAAVEENLDFTDMQLSSLDYLTARPPNWRDSSSMEYNEQNLHWFPANRPADGTSPLDLVMAESPDVWAVYYPNETYRELHTTLHNIILETAKKTGLTRSGTPERSAPRSPDENAGLTHEPAGSSRLTYGPGTLQKVSSKLKISPHREMELWGNYLHEIAPWLDMFDNQQHFQYTLPVLAKGVDHLRLSVLALSARQMERRSSTNPYIESLDLYQEAIQLMYRSCNQWIRLLLHRACSCVFLK